MRQVFWLWQSSGEDLRLLWAALRRPNRPRWLLPAVIGVAFLVLDPVNFAILPVGLVDEVVLLPLLLRLLAHLASAPSRTPGDRRARDSRVVSVQ